MAKVTKKSSPKRPKKKGSSSKKWIQNAVKKPGQLHKDLGVPEGEKIPEGEIAKAAKRPGKVGQRARFALNMKKIRRGKK
jgi:hypothetical protein